MTPLNSRHLFLRCNDLVHHFLLRNTLKTIPLHSAEHPPPTQPTSCGADEARHAWDTGCAPDQTLVSQKSQVPVQRQCSAVGDLCLQHYFIRVCRNHLLNGPLHQRRACRCWSTSELQLGCIGFYDMHACMQAGCRYRHLLTCMNNSGTGAGSTEGLTNAQPPVVILDDKHGDVASLGPSVVVRFADHHPKAVRAVKGQPAQLGPIVQEVPACHHFVTIPCRLHIVYFLVLLA